MLKAQNGVLARGAGGKGLPVALTGVETLVRVSKRGAGVSKRVSGGSKRVLVCQNTCWGFKIHGWGLEM